MILTGKMATRKLLDSALRVRGAIPLAYDEKHTKRILKRFDALTAHALEFASRRWLFRKKHLRELLKFSYQIKSSNKLSMTEIRIHNTAAECFRHVLYALTSQNRKPTGQDSTQD